MGNESNTWEGLLMKRNNAPEKIGNASFHLFTQLRKNMLIR